MLTLHSDPSTTLVAAIGGRTVAMDIESISPRPTSRVRLVGSIALGLSAFALLLVVASSNGVQLSLLGLRMLGSHSSLSPMSNEMTAPAPEIFWAEFSTTQ